MIFLLEKKKKKKNITTTYKKPVFGMYNVDGTFASFVIEAVHNGASDSVYQIDIDKWHLLAVLARSDHSHQIRVQVFVQNASVSQHFSLRMDAIVWELGGDRDDLLIFQIHSPKFWQLLANQKSSTRALHSFQNKV
jgi:hypothetical protein